MVKSIISACLSFLKRVCTKQKKKVHFGKSNGWGSEPNIFSKEVTHVKKKSSYFYDGVTGWVKKSNVDQDVP